MKRLELRRNRANACLRSVALLALAFGCGGPQKLGNAGAKCFRDDDCEAGLICVAPKADANRVCSNDPTPLISMVEGPEPIAMGGTAGAAGAMNGGGGGTGGGGGANMAGTSTGGQATGGTDTGGTDTGGTDTGGTDTGGTDTGGTTSDGGAPP